MRLDDFAPRARVRVMAFALCSALVLRGGYALAACGQPLSSGAAPTASDCLYVLRSAVQLQTCELCTCDIDGSTKVLATDALFCLKRAVGLQVAFNCPQCGGSQTLTLLDDARIGSDPDADNFQHASVDFSFASGPFANAKLIVDLDSTCYPFEDWTQPPPGQNWPADCDAFDRLFEITLDEPVTGADPPAIELVHAVTPFGGPLHIEADITDVANGLPGSHELAVFIGTYSDATGHVTGSDGGWNVTVRVELTPGAAPRHVLAVVPLLKTSYTSATSSLSAPFEVPPGTAATRLEYRATGHGGGSPSGDPACIGPAEEFCKRTHHVRVDGAGVQAGVLQPWRDDCDELCTVAHYGSPGFNYCLENPTGVMASVRAPRANWCPGSATPPLTWDPPASHDAGAHELEVAIDDVVAGGAWEISAVLFAFGD